VLTSTSWTPDEDFPLLLSSLSSYDSRARTHTLPPILVVITGRGPLREAYMERVERAQRAWVNVRCVSVWVEPGDYPLLLGAFLLLRLGLVVERLLGRVGGFGDIAACVLICSGSPDEDGGYVWMRIARVRAGFCLVRLLSLWCESTDGCAW
jgi:hypothetical protein